MLIAGPVQGHYKYEDEAIDRIFTLSQGKPFSIQLICDECLKRAREKQPGSTITLADVDAVWPRVQRRLESEKQAEASTVADISSPVVHQPSPSPAKQIAEEKTSYKTKAEETTDDP